MSDNERSEEGWYLDTTSKRGLHSNMLTLPAVEVTIFLPQRPRIQSHSEGLSTGPAGGSSKTRRRALWVTRVEYLIPPILSSAAPIDNLLDKRSETRKDTAIISGKHMP